VDQQWIKRDQEWTKRNSKESREIKRNVEGLFASAGVTRSVSTTLQAWRGLEGRHPTDNWTRAITKQLGWPCDRLMPCLKACGEKEADKAKAEKGRRTSLVDLRQARHPSRRHAICHPPCSTTLPTSLFMFHPAINPSICSASATNATSATVGLIPAQSSSYSPSLSSNTPDDNSPLVGIRQTWKQPIPNM
jgi:hypothetical protein